MFFIHVLPTEYNFQIFHVLRATIASITLVELCSVYNCFVNKFQKSATLDHQMLNAYFRAEIRLRCMSSKSRCRLEREETRSDKKDITLSSSATSTTGGNNVVPASSILTVDQDTLSTMQAEMIAVQVLSQSGDVQLFQKQSGGSTQIVPVTTISSGELRALTQVKIDVVYF